MYFGSNGNNNICLAGPQSGGSFYDHTGYNPLYVRNCSCWCIIFNTVNNTSFNCYVYSANSPRIYAGLQGSTNQSLGYIRNCDRIHGVNAYTANTTQGCVKFNHPFSTSLAVAAYMYSNLPLSNTTPCVTIQASSNYGYFFANWRANSPTGGVITNVATTNLFTTGTYGSTPYESLRNVYATFTSDKRLKKNIKLIGKSKQGYNIYSFEFKNPKKFGYGTYQGVIAQEVIEHSTWNSEGYLTVDYSKIDVKFKKLYGSNLGFGKRNKIRGFLQSIKNFIINSISLPMEKIPS